MQRSDALMSIRLSFFSADVFLSWADLLQCADGVPQAGYQVGALLARDVCI